MESDAVRQELETLERILAQHGEAKPAQLIQAALGASAQDLRAFLVSNELWGGSGSIADQAGINQGRDVRRAIEAALVRLGQDQMRQGVVNVRTAMWVDAFSQWQRQGI